MDPNVVSTVITAAIGTLLVGSLLTWAAVLRRLRNGQDLLAWSPRRPVPWGLLDVGAAFLLLLIFEAAALQSTGVDPQSDLASLAPAEQVRAFLSMATGRIAATALVLLMLVVRLQARGADWGFSWRELRADIRLGCRVFLFVAPPIYGLQQLLSTLWTPTAHPLVVSVQNNPQVGVFAAACAAAVVSAPLTEEFLLRVVLQGWLEKVAVWQGDSTALLVGGAMDDEHGATEWTRHQRRGKASEAQREQFKHRPPHWPIFISALVFALMHLQKEPSPDPIPLFFFALALGYVYQRTHRLLPCVVMHVLLNAASMTLLGLSVFCPEGVPSWLPQ